MEKLDIQTAREIVWEKLRPVAVPDPDFGYDFSEFIADYAGSDEGARLFVKQPFYKNARTVFVTPDDNVNLIREFVIRDGKDLVMTDYGIEEGFFVVRAGSVVPELEPYITSYEGLKKVRQHRTLAQLREEIGHIDLLVTGASAVTPDGLRFGKGHGYFDLEWAMLYTKGLVDASSVTVAAVHDCQVIDADVQATEHDTVLDYIVTPTRSIATGSRHPKPDKGILWDKLQPDMLGRIAPLRELWAEHKAKK